LDGECSEAAGQLEDEKMGQLCITVLG